MIDRANVITGILGVGIGAAIILLIRRDKMRVGYSIWWFAIALAIILMGFFPTFVDVIGELLGVHYPPILFMVTAICALLLKVLTMDIEHTRHGVQIKTLVQRVALLEARYGKATAGEGQATESNRPGKTVGDKA